MRPASFDQWTFLVSFVATLDELSCGLERIFKLGWLKGFFFLFLDAIREDKHVVVDVLFSEDLITASFASFLQHVLINVVLLEIDAQRVGQVGSGLVTFAHSEWFLH